MTPQPSGKFCSGSLHHAASILPAKLYSSRVRQVPLTTFEGLPAQGDRGLEWCCHFLCTWWSLLTCRFPLDCKLSEDWTLYSVMSAPGEPCNSIQEMLTCEQDPCLVYRVLFTEPRELGSVLVFVKPNTTNKMPCNFSPPLQGGLSWTSSAMLAGNVTP